MYYPAQHYYGIGLFLIQKRSDYTVRQILTQICKITCARVRLNTAQDSWVHSGHDAVILFWYRTCIWLQYIIVIELSKFCTDKLKDLGVMKDFLIFLQRAAHYTTGWLIDHAWKSNKQITIVSWPNKSHHKMDFYIFYLINNYS